MATVCTVEWFAAHPAGLIPILVVIALDFVELLTLPILTLLASWLVVLYLVYVVGASVELARHLNIWVLRLGPRVVVVGGPVAQAPRVPG